MKPDSILVDECGLCHRPVRWGDSRATRVNGGTEVQETVHYACTAEGVRRWLREGRPHESPVEAARIEGWSFTDLDGGEIPFQNRTATETDERLHDMLTDR